MANLALLTPCSFTANQEHFNYLIDQSESLFSIPVLVKAGLSASVKVVSLFLVLLACTNIASFPDVFIIQYNINKNEISMTG